MAKKKATSMDVAREAGVSQATVSMILNKKYNVSFSKETIRQVTEAAEKLDYHLPKQRIRRSAKSRKLLVVFCPTLTNPYYVMLLQGIEAMAKEYGYGVFVCNTQRDLKIEENYLRMMREVQPLGIIYACNPSFSRQVAELSGEIPVVVISNRDDEFSIDAVALNNQKPGILMARHLLELGHRDVAFIAPPLTARQPSSPVTSARKWRFLRVRPSLWVRAARVRCAASSVARVASRARSPQRRPAP